MPRNMSFYLTTEQVRKRQKTVTRRLGWWNVKPGEIINACVKCQGLGKGGKIERICQIRVTKESYEPLERMLKPAYGRDEATKEGFPGMSGEEFVVMFCEHMKCDSTAVVKRIEFEYLEPTA